MTRSFTTLSLLAAVAQLLPITKFCEAQECTLCFGGEEANLTMTVGGAADGVACSVLVSDLNVDEEACRGVQLLGFRYCDCPSYPTEHFCPMCQDSFTDIPDRFKVIPGPSGTTCDDELFVPIGDVDSCQEAMKPGFVCGCPDAEEPDCKICDGDTNDVAEVGEERLTVNTVGSYTCQEWANQAVLGDLTVEECALVSAEAFEFCKCPGSSDDMNNSTAGVDNDSGTDDDMNNATTLPVETDATPAPTPTQDSAGYSSRRSIVSAAAAAVGVFLSQVLFL